MVARTHARPAAALLACQSLTTIGSWHQSPMASSASEAPAACVHNERHARLSNTSTHTPPVPLVSQPRTRMRACHRRQREGGRGVQARRLGRLVLRAAGARRRRHRHPGQIRPLRLCKVSSRARTPRAQPAAAVSAASAALRLCNWGGAVAPSCITSPLTLAGCAAACMQHQPAIRAQPQQHPQRGVGGLPGEACHDPCCLNRATHRLLS